MLSMQGDTPLHYSQIQRVVKFLESIPSEDAHLIAHKPDTTDRQRDPLWRRRCAKYGVSTAPLGVSKGDRAEYDRKRQMELHIAKLERKEKVMGEEMRRLKTQLAHHRVLADRDLSVGEQKLEAIRKRRDSEQRMLVAARSLREWVRYHMCSSCVAKWKIHFQNRKKIACESCAKLLDDFVSAVLD